MELPRDIEAVEKDLMRVRRLAEAFAGAVRAHFGDRLKEARLFGSGARGDWFPGSDIDVLILLDEVNSPDFSWIVAKAMDMGLLDSGWYLQPVIMAQREFQQLLDRERRFPQEVMKEGIAL